VRARVQCLADQLRFAVNGEDHQACGREILAQLADHIHAADLRQHQINNDHFGAERGGGGQRVLAIGRVTDEFEIGVISQTESQAFQNDRMVIDNQNSDSSPIARRHSVSCAPIEIGISGHNDKEMWFGVRSFYVGLYTYFT